MTLTIEEIRRAREDIFGPTIKGDYTLVEKQVLLADKIARHSDTIKAALDLAEKLLPKPIEEAPRDGTRIIGFWGGKNDGPNCIDVVEWYSGDWYDPEDTSYDYPLSSPLYFWLPSDLPKAKGE